MIFVVWPKSESAVGIKLDEWLVSVFLQIQATHGTS